MEEKIIEILVNVTGEDSLRTDRDVNLFETGLLDSLGVVDVIVELEEEFDIVISPTEVEREDFDTPNKICAVVKEKVDE